MWPGVVAGFATLSLARLAHAQNLLFRDQQLAYKGLGWETFVAPQSCAGVSPTVHATSNPGDQVLFSFNGTAIFVRGPASRSNQMSFVLDGVVQPTLPATLDSSGCGILYSNLSIPGNEQHTLVMVYDRPLSPFQISGITITPPAAAPTFAARPPSSVAALPNTSQILPQTTSTNVKSTTASPTSGTDPTSSAVLISGATMTPGMIAGVITAVVVTIVGMILLLVLSLFLQRRITRRKAQRFDLGFEQEVEEGKGNGRAPLTYRKPLPANAVWIEKGTTYKVDQNLDYSPETPVGNSSVLPAVATSMPSPRHWRNSSSGTQYRYSIHTVSTAQSHVSAQFGASSTHVVNLDFAGVNGSQKIADMPDVLLPSTALTIPHERTSLPATSFQVLGGARLPNSLGLETTRTARVASLVEGSRVSGRPPTGYF